MLYIQIDVPKGIRENRGRVRARVSTKEQDREREVEEEERAVSLYRKRVSVQHSLYRT